MTTTLKQPTRKVLPKKREGSISMDEQPNGTAKTTKLDLIITQLTREEGASMMDLIAITGWQAHSVRGALAGSLKKKGHVIISEKIDGVRHYRIGAAR